MIMKTVQKGTDKIEHVEYGDNVIFFHSFRNKHGRTKTETISRRIIGRTMREHTDEEYNTLLETVIKSARDVVIRKSSDKKKASCRSCRKNGVCKGIPSCSASFA